MKVGEIVQNLNVEKTKKKMLEANEVYLKYLTDEECRYYTIHIQTYNQDDGFKITQELIKEALFQRLSIVRAHSSEDLLNINSINGFGKRGENDLLQSLTH